MKTEIGAIFDIYWGQKEYHSKENLNAGNTLLISSQGTDNGCYGFFNIPIKYTDNIPFITVPSTGSIGEAFVQDMPCCVDDDCLILIAKEKMNISKLYQVVYQIRKNKWRYAYGRKITPYRLKKQTVRLEEINIEYEKLIKSLMPKEKLKNKLSVNKNIRLIKLIDLCEINKKQGVPLNSILSEGTTPYISSSSQDNGVVAFTNKEPNAKAKSLTVAKDGNDGYSFYQPIDFITSIHNYILTLKNNYPPYLLLYIGAVIKRRAYCYNHYYPLSKKHLEKIEIPMPLNGTGDYDFEYIEKIIKNCYGYDELKRYL